MTTANLGDLIRNAKPQDFTPVPVGSYAVTVESAEFKFSKAGNPGFKLTFVIDEGEPHAGRKLWRDLTLTENSVGIVVDQMKTLGVSQELLADATENDPSAVCRALVDARAIVRVKHREFDGRTQSDVDRILPPRDAAPSPLAVPSDTARPATAAPVRPF